MTRQISDAEVQLLAGISQTLRADYAADELAWEGSPFAWIKTRPSRQVGAIGEQLVAAYCAAKNLNVVRSPDGEADRVIEGIRVEIKFSTLWHAGGYKFQQLRDQNYGLAVCLGISPFDAHLWVLPKSLILENWGNAAGLQSQHGGRAGRDTAWLSVRPSEVQAWLRPYGGSLKDGFSVLRRELARETDSSGD